MNTTDTGNPNPCQAKDFQVGDTVRRKGCRYMVDATLLRHLGEPSDIVDVSAKMLGLPLAQEVAE